MSSPCLLTTDIIKYIVSFIIELWKHSKAKHSKQYSYHRCRSSDSWCSSRRQTGQQCSIYRVDKISSLMFQWEWQNITPYVSTGHSIVQTEDYLPSLGNIYIYYNNIITFKKVNALQLIIICLLTCKYEDIFPQPRILFPRYLKCNIFSRLDNIWSKTDYPEGNFVYLG